MALATISWRHDEAPRDAETKAQKLPTARRLANKEMGSFLIWVPQGIRVKAMADNKGRCTLSPIHISYRVYQSLQ
jgi:hypothetical protein